jgi:predicted transcriptional regulator
MARRPQGSVPQCGLGKAVQSLRDEADMTPTALAIKSDNSTSWISQVEAGEVDPTWGAMRSIVAALEVSMEYLAEVAERFEETGVPAVKGGGSALDRGTVEEGAACKHD